MTLTGALPDEEREPVRAALEVAFAERVPREPVDIDALSLPTQSDRARAFEPGVRVMLGSGAITAI